MTNLEDYIDALNDNEILSLEEELNLAGLNDNENLWFPNEIVEGIPVINGNVLDNETEITLPIVTGIKIEY
jgi:hypothetical protein